MSMDSGTGGDGIAVPIYDGATNARQNVALTANVDVIGASAAEARALGAPHYFTGLPCKNGHVAKRRTNGSQCIACDPDKGERARRWRFEHPEKNREKNRIYRKTDRPKYLANKAVEQAVKSGALMRAPCQRCGSTELVHAHHDDYSRPLDVMWLCPTHHKERHREIAPMGMPYIPTTEVPPAVNRADFVAWSESEIGALRDLRDAGYRPQEIADRLGRSISSVKGKTHGLGLSSRRTKSRDGKRVILPGRSSSEPAAGAAKPAPAGFVRGEAS